MSMPAKIAAMVTREGKIIIQSGANVWPHELKTAEALAAAGYTVEFVRRSEEQRAQSADVMMLGEVWEMKAPRSDKASAIDKTCVWPCTRRNGSSSTRAA